MGQGRRHGCDYTGWGCQDGAELRYFDDKPTPSELKGESGSEPDAAEWDTEPADLNRWLQTQAVGAVAGTAE